MRNAALAAEFFPDPCARKIRTLHDMRAFDKAKHLQGPACEPESRLQWRVPEEEPTSKKTRISTRHPLASPDRLEIHEDTRYM